MWKEILEIFGNIFAIITGGVGLIFLFREQNRRLHVTIRFEREKISTKSVDEYGNPTKRIVPGIRAELINQAILDVNIHKFVLMVNGRATDTYPFNFYKSKGYEDNTVTAGKRRHAFFAGQEVYDATYPAKRIFFRLKVIDETGKVFRSNFILCSAPERLQDPEQILDEYLQDKAPLSKYWLRKIKRKKRS